MTSERGFIYICLLQDDFQLIGRLRRYYGFRSIDRISFEDYFADSEAAEAALQEMQSCVFLLQARRDLSAPCSFLSYSARGIVCLALRATMPTLKSWPSWGPRFTA